MLGPASLAVHAAIVAALLASQAEAGVPVGLGCGDANGDLTVTATDASIALRSGVGAELCDGCVCDVNRSGATNATDALLILQFGVGQPVILDCLSCSTTTTTLVCSPKSLSGSWDLTITDVEDNCGGVLEPPFRGTGVLDERPGGVVVLVSPQIPGVSNVSIERNGCLLDLSFRRLVNQGTAVKEFSGRLTVSGDGDAIMGDVTWVLCDPDCRCDGLDNWVGIRQSN